MQPHPPPPPPITTLPPLTIYLLTSRHPHPQITSFQSQIPSSPHPILIQPIDTLAHLPSNLSPESSIVLLQTKELMRDEGMMRGLEGVKRRGVRVLMHPVRIVPDEYYEVVRGREEIWEVVEEMRGGRGEVGGGGTGGGLMSVRHMQHIEYHPPPPPSTPPLTSPKIPIFLLSSPNPAFSSFSQSFLQTYLPHPSLSPRLIQNLNQLSQSSSSHPSNPPILIVSDTDAGRINKQLNMWKSSGQQNRVRTIVYQNEGVQVPSQELYVLRAESGEEIERYVAEAVKGLVGRGEGMGMGMGGSGVMGNSGVSGNMSMGMNMRPNSPITALNPPPRSPPHNPSLKPPLSPSIATSRAFSSKPSPSLSNKIRLKSARKLSPSLPSSPTSLLLILDNPSNKPFTDFHRSLPFPSKLITDLTPSMKFQGPKTFILASYDQRKQLLEKFHKVYQNVGFVFYTHGVVMPDRSIKHPLVELVTGEEGDIVGFLREKGVGGALRGSAMMNTSPNMNPNLNRSPLHSVLNSNLKDIKEWYSFPIGPGVFQTSSSEKSMINYNKNGGRNQQEEYRNQVVTRPQGENLGLQMKYPAMGLGEESMNPYYPKQIADALDVLMKDIRMAQGNRIGLDMRGGRGNLGYEEEQEMVIVNPKRSSNIMSNSSSLIAPDPHTQPHHATLITRQTHFSPPPFAHPSQIPHPSPSPSTSPPPLTLPTQSLHRTPSSPFHNQLPRQFSPSSSQLQKRNTAKFNNSDIRYEWTGEKDYFQTANGQQVPRTSINNNQRLMSFKRPQLESGIEELMYEEERGMGRGMGYAGLEKEIAGKAMNYLFDFKGGDGREKEWDVFMSPEQGRWRCVGHEVYQSMPVGKKVVNKMNVANNSNMNTLMKPNNKNLNMNGNYNVSTSQYYTQTTTTPLPLPPLIPSPTTTSNLLPKPITQIPTVSKMSRFQYGSSNSELLTNRPLNIVAANIGLSLFNIGPTLTQKEWHACLHTQQSKWHLIPHSDYMKNPTRYLPQPQPLGRTSNTHRGLSSYGGVEYDQMRGSGAAATVPGGGNRNGRDIFEQIEYVPGRVEGRDRPFVNVQKEEIKYNLEQLQNNMIDTKQKGPGITERVEFGGQQQTIFPFTGGKPNSAQNYPNDLRQQTDQEREIAAMIFNNNYFNSSPPPTVPTLSPTPINTNPLIHIQEREVHYESPYTVAVTTPQNVISKYPKKGLTISRSRQELLSREHQPILSPSSFRPAATTFPTHEPVEPIVTFQQSTIHYQPQQPPLILPTQHRPHQTVPPLQINRPSLQHPLPLPSMNSFQQQLTLPPTHLIGSNHPAQVILSSPSQQNLHYQQIVRTEEIRTNYHSPSQIMFNGGGGWYGGSPQRTLNSSRSKSGKRGIRNTLLEDNPGFVDNAKVQGNIVRRGEGSGRVGRDRAGSPSQFYFPGEQMQRQTVQIIEERQTVIPTRDYSDISPPPQRPPSQYSPTKPLTPTTLSSQPIQLLFKSSSSFISQLTLSFPTPPYQLHPFLSPASLSTLSSTLSPQLMTVLLTDQIPTDTPLQQLFYNFSNFNCIIIPKDKLYKIQQGRYPGYKWIVEVNPTVAVWKIKEYLNRYNYVNEVVRLSGLKGGRYGGKLGGGSVGEERRKGWSVLVSAGVRNQLPFDPSIRPTFFTPQTISTLLPSPTPTIIILPPSQLPLIQSLASPHDKLLILLPSSSIIPSSLSISTSAELTTKNPTALLTHLNRLLNLHPSTPSTYIFYYFDEIDLSEMIQKRLGDRVVQVKYHDQISLRRKVKELGGGQGEEGKRLVLVVKEEFVGLVEEIRGMAGNVRVVYYGVSGGRELGKDGNSIVCRTLQQVLIDLQNNS